ncbi:Oidioi.mRNA.OKI2018_I69.chrUn_7.g17249.t1.cds [Oikopleura dioica]|uniref:Oidioi.mRNA.OKI2018_I69.chrUn_7.g17249.t1.c ds n=1 Tax=Oikopleura dioica TaxID=34765 RepID=A0ABN7TFH1_OIKDI|nr:Oidioi.mRNA.OKI2018_I69.chrUn_7.g17249.t1.cds [Oikopleura dioica]
MPSIRKVITVFFSHATIGVAVLVAKLFFDEHQRKKGQGTEKENEQRTPRHAGKDGAEPEERVQILS